jgi:hypothetical protein
LLIRLQLTLQHSLDAVHVSPGLCPRHVGSGAQIPPLHFLSVSHSVRSALSAQNGTVGQVTGGGQVGLGDARFFFFRFLAALADCRLIAAAAPRRRPAMARRLPGCHSIAIIFMSMATSLLVVGKNER